MSGYISSSMVNSQLKSLTDEQEKEEKERALSLAPIVGARIVACANSCLTRLNGLTIILKSILKQLTFKLSRFTKRNYLRLAMISQQLNLFCRKGLIS